MSEWVKWFFDGLGTEIISLIIGIVGGGLFGFRVGKRKSKFIQTQEAGSGSEQYQNGKSVSKTDKNNKESPESTSTFLQSQKAGENSKQLQIGGHDNV